MSSLSAFGWLQSSLGIDITGEWNSIVSFSVGGCSFSCQRRTFKCCAESSVLCQMALAQDQRTVTKTEDGSIVLDRDPETFRHVLNFLRSGAQRLLLPDDFGDWDLLMDDARVYGLQQLSDAIRSHPKYQQRCFAQNLPQGVMVRWTTWNTNSSSIKKKPQQQQQQPQTTGAPAETESSSSSSSSSSHQQQQHAIEIFPPLQLLEVDAGGSSLKFQGRQVSSVDEAVAIILFTFSMHIETWHRDTIGGGGGEDGKIAHTIFFTKK